MAAITISGTAATVDANGVLNCLVQQPVDNTPSETANGMEYTEKYKGPYSKLKDILAHISVGNGIDAAHSALNEIGAIQGYFNAPICPVRIDSSVDPVVEYGGEWKVAAIQVDQLAAGSHAIVTIKYAAIYNRMLHTDQDVWSLSWQSYSVDPYSFCKNDPANLPYPCSPSFETDPTLDLPDQRAEYWTEAGVRSNIDKYLTGLHESKVVNGKTYYYYTPNEQQLDVRYFLNGPESAVMKKKLLGRSATYHYPVLTHQTVTSQDLSAAMLETTIGDEIDHVVENLPADCPYTFPKKDNKDVWVWVKTGDEMSESKDLTTKQVTFTRHETYSGFTDVDRNFYGNAPFTHDENGILSGRWQIGGL